MDIIALVAHAYLNSLIEAQKSDFMKFLLHNFFVSWIEARSKIQKLNRRASSIKDWLETVHTVESVIEIGLVFIFWILGADFYSSFYQFLLNKFSRIFTASIQDTKIWNVAIQICAVYSFLKLHDFVLVFSSTPTMTYISFLIHAKSACVIKIKSP